MNKISSLRDLIPDFMAKTGLNRMRKTDDLAEKWAEVADIFRPHAVFDALRRGVLEIIVSDTIIIQELTFRKAELLRKMREAYPDAKFKDIRFRVGTLEPGVESGE